MGNAHYEFSFLDVAIDNVAMPDLFLIVDGIAVFAMVVFFDAIKYGAAVTETLIGLCVDKMRGQGPQRRRCLPAFLFAGFIALLLFVGFALYDWTDAQAKLPEIPASVAMFIVYAVFAIQATLCLVALELLLFFFHT